MRVSMVERNVCFLDPKAMTKSVVEIGGMGLGAARILVEAIRGELPVV